MPKLLILLSCLLFASCASTSKPVKQEKSVGYERKEALTDTQITMSGFTPSSIASRDLAGYRKLKRALVLFAGEDQLARLSKIAPDVEFVGNPSLQVGEDVTGQFDAVILACTSPSALEFAHNAAWIHSYSAGVENCLAHPALQKENKIITNSRGTTASIIGEHAMSMVMSMSRGLHKFRDAQAEANWVGRLDLSNRQTTTVGGKTLLVLGLGSIGKEVARRANALGMRVIATRNSSRTGPDYVDYVGLSDETFELAKQADVVVNALPLTSKTENLLNEEFFSTMKSSALLVSVGRGGTTDTDALVAALESGSIAGAALDVTNPEPLPQDHPLWQHKNVIITPHIAGTGGDARIKVQELLLENVRRYQAGEPLLNPVNAKKGY